MQFYYILKTKLPILAVISLFIGVSSCGSYQYTGTDNDGIYGSNTRSTTVEAQPKTTTNSAYYKNYFEEKDQYADINDPNAVFTDIDSYEGDYAIEVDSTESNQESYAGWGQTNDNVEINVYTRPNYAWGWGRPIGWNRGWNFGLNWWNNPWSWGNVGFYDPYWCPTFYGGYGYGGLWRPWNNYNFYRPYNNFYGSYHNGYRRDVAYNTGRRSSIYSRNTNNISRRSTNNYSSRRSINNSRRTIARRSTRGTNGRIDGRHNSQRPRINRPNTQRPRVNSTRSRVNKSSSQRPRVNRSNNNSRPRTNNYSRGSSSKRSYSSPSRSSSRSSSRSTRSSRRRG